MKSFLQYVAKDILAKHPEGLSDIAIVFPNKRASLFLNEALYEEAGQPLWSPAYLTISDLFRRHSDLQVPDQIWLVFKLYNIYCDITGSDEPLDHFFSWGQLLLSDFDDIDKNMADADKLFVNLEAWQEMKDFSFLTEAQRESLENFFGKIMDDTRMQHRFNEIWRHLGTIYHAYRDALEAEHMAYEGMLYREVAERGDTNFHYRTYIFVGFNLLQKVEQRLFTTLNEMGKAEFYWDYDNSYIGRGNEAGRYIAQYKDRFVNQLSRTHATPGIDPAAVYDTMQQPKDITYVSAPTENIQARYVGEWLKQNNRIADGSRTAIVLGNEKLLETVVHCLPDEVDSVNITTGFPLASSPVSTLVSALFALQLRGRVDKTDKYRLKYIRPVLQHPYAKYLSPHCAPLYEELNTHKHYFPNRRLLTEGYDETIALLFADLQPNKGQLPIMPWVAALLKQVGIGSREDKNPLTHEAIFRMYKLINRLDDIMVPVTADAPLSATNTDGQTGKQLVSIAILQRLMTQVIQSTSIPFHGEPLLGIQVMGVLETRNLDFDHVLLLSCNEGNLPKSVNDASFIPHSLRAGYELTTVENKVAIYAYYFHALLQRATDITLTFNNATDDGKKSEMSRFMLQYMVENAHRQPIAHATLQSGQSATPVLRQPVEKDDTVTARLQEIERLSPSAINRYLRCPLQFYYNTVCRLRETDDDDSEEEIDNVMFGNLFHRTAELVYLDLSAHATRPVTRDGIDHLLKNRPQLDAHIDQAFREILFKVSDRPFRQQYNGLQRLNKEVIRRYVSRLLALDRQLTPFDILALERSFYDNLTFCIGGQSRTISVGGQVDRLDRVSKDGQQVIRVVDYKTGAPLTTRPANMDEIFSPDHVDTKHSTYYLQAFLYAGIVRRGEEAAAEVNPGRLPVAPALFFIRQTASDNYDPTLVLTPARGQRETVEDIDTKYDEFMEHLRQLIEEIFNPAVPFVPTADSKRCTSCPYSSICGL